MEGCGASEEEGRGGAGAFETQGSSGGAPPWLQPGVAVRIVSGTHKWKSGVVHRVTAQKVWVMLDGADRAKVAVVCVMQRSVAVAAAAADAESDSAASGRNRQRGPPPPQPHGGSGEASSVEQLTKRKPPPPVKLSREEVLACWIAGGGKQERPTSV